MATIQEIPALFTESIDQIRDQIRGYLPETLSQEEGALGGDFVEVMTLKAVIDRDRLNTVIRQTFIGTANGTFLDAHAAGLGTTRGAGTKATGTVRLTAPSGTIIPPGVRVLVPGTDPTVEPLTFVTTNAAPQTVTALGYIDLAIAAADIGNEFNQPVGAITYLGSIVDGVTAVSNTVAITGGSDIEDDDTLRARLLEEAENPPGSGTAQDYRIWAAAASPAVGDVAVQELWDNAAVTPGAGDPSGSVLVSLRGSDFTAVDWSVVQTVQKNLDPTRQEVALLENGEPWSVLSGAATQSWSSTKEMGASSLSLAFAGAGTTVVVLDRAMDFSRFLAGSELFAWFQASAWANVVNTTALRFETDASNYYECPLSSVSSGGTAKPTTGSAWWLWRANKSQFVATGTPNWASISRVRLTAVAVTGAVTVLTDAWSFRDFSGAIGEGRAPIGHDVTVITPVPKTITVVATISLAAGYTLTGAVGTTNVGALIRDGLRVYLNGLRPGDPVRFNDVANVLHDTPGVLDFSALTVGGTATTPGSTVVVTSSEYAALGTVTLT